MRWMRLTALLCLIAASALAWTSPKLSCVVNSAPEPGGSVTVHADVTGPFPYLDPMTALLFYSTDNQVSWTELAMSPVGEPGYDSTFAAVFTISTSGNVYYYVRAKDTFGFATQSPANTANVWPPGTNLLARVADEPAGDVTNNPDGPFLDLTGIWMGYSGTHFYARMTNNDDEWPIGNIITDWYLYAAGFRNPDAPQDTWTFAMAYGNVLGIYTPGLYVINGYTEDFERFADIDYVTDGNVLNMRCLISDLAGHPGFGPWPNPSGFLRAARGDTRSVDWQSNAALHDTTNQSRYYVDRTPRFTVGQNNSPVADNPRVIPASGTPETLFRFYVDYTDPDSNLPTVRQLLVDNDTFDLEPAHHRYWETVVFNHKKDGFGPGRHQYRFLFNDGMSQVISESDSFEVYGTGIAAVPPSPATRLLANPNPFTTEVRLQVPPGTRLLRVLNSAGRFIRDIPTRFGQTATWDGTDRNGSPVPPGVYFCRDAAGPLRRLRLVRLAR